MEALSRDVKCFESFESLVGGEMMTAEEGRSDLLSGASEARCSTWCLNQG